jgi:hypothetical protein
MIAVLLLTTAGAVQANDQEIWTKTVPASACTPATSAQASRVSLVNAAWVFSGTQTGTVTFYCPLPVNAYTVVNLTNDNDISSFRIYYRDSDGVGADAELTARLVYREASGLFSAGGTWSSNSPATAAGETGNRRDVQPNVHDVRTDALYSFLVTMARTTTSQAPSFAGIDFPFPTP